MYAKKEIKMSKFSKRSVSNKRIIKNQILEKELSCLRNLLPIVNAKPNSSKLVIINEAIKYIDQLEKQVLLKWTMHQRLINQRLVLSSSKLKKTQPKIIGKK